MEGNANIYLATKSSSTVAVYKYLVAVHRVPSMRECSALIFTELEVRTDADRADLPPRPYRSTLGSRVIADRSAAADASSETLVCSPLFLSPWQIRYA